MPAWRSAARSTTLAVAGVVVVLAGLALPGMATARDAKRPPPHAGPTARTGGEDAGNPGYHYAAGQTQVLETKASGLRATFSVHRPRQVYAASGQHSLAQVAMGHTRDGSYLEAGWRQHLDGPRLFIYWRPADGRDTCYNFGCGFRPEGPGLRPGTALQPGSEVTVAFQHVRNKWWFKVNGLRSGYFPDRLWEGKFKGTDFAQIYGEVWVGPNQPICADMGNGRAPRHPSSAHVRDIEWIGGPPLVLHRATTVREVHKYYYKQTGRNSFRYGGPGEC